LYPLGNFEVWSLLTNLYRHELIFNYTPKKITSTTYFHFFNKIKRKESGKPSFLFSVFLRDGSAVQFAF